jgi:hypothetical protein
MKSWPTRDDLIRELVEHANEMRKSGLSGSMEAVAAAMVNFERMVSRLCDQESGIGSIALREDSEGRCAIPESWEGAKAHFESVIKSVVPEASHVSDLPKKGYIRMANGEVRRRMVLSLPPDLGAELDQLAALTGSSLTFHVERLLRDAMNAQDSDATKGSWID